MTNKLLIIIQYLSLRGSSTCMYNLVKGYRLTLIHLNEYDDPDNKNVESYLCKFKCQTFYIRLKINRGLLFACH